MSIKFLEVGKRYKTREGSATVEIIGKVPHRETTDLTLYQFFGSDGLCYTENGLFYEDRETPYDLLVSEEPILQLEVGGVYQTRDGKSEITIVNKRDYTRASGDYTPSYPFFGDNNCRYTKEGHVVDGYETPFDLIRKTNYREDIVQTAAFKIEVGKTYWTRNRDNKITITAESNFDHGAEGSSKIFPFIGNDGCPYTSEGHFFVFGESDHDLVEEVTTENAGLRLEVGKSYRTRDGLSIVKIVGIEKPGDKLYRESHPYAGDDQEAYTESGRFNNDPTLLSEFDLVEEVDLDEVA